MNVKNSLAPIALFVYNRPDHTLQTLQALENNELAKESVLYIFCDGPKVGLSNEELKAIQNVRDIVQSKNWCAQTIIEVSDTNKGLANSIIKGVTRIIDKHEKIIVLEDDIVTSPGFLKYMNDSLNLYQDEEKVMHISAYQYPISFPSDSDTFFINILSCWGWGSWKRAWSNFENDTNLLIEKAKKQISIKKFNIYGGANFYQQLLDNASGKINTWAVKWYASWLLSGGYSLFPKKTLVVNIGHDGTGEHCYSTNLFSSENFLHDINVHSIAIEENFNAKKQIDRYYRKNFPKSKFSFYKKSLIRNFNENGINGILLKTYTRLYEKILKIVFPNINFDNIKNIYVEVKTEKNVNIRPTYKLANVTIGKYTTIGSNSSISHTTIGRFCSIGPNFLCGWGIHPTNSISSSPVFYSKSLQTGKTFAKENKIIERTPIKIGNDVFIGANVTILDGVTIGDGCVIGAGAVVVKDVEPYAIIGGVPAKNIKMRFSEENINKLLKIKWWNWDDLHLQEVEAYFFDVDKFINKHEIK